jgi:hypothetical protein
MSAGNLPARPDLPVPSGQGGPSGQGHAEPGAVVSAPPATPVAPIDAKFEIGPAETSRPMRAPPILGALTVIFGITALYKATVLLAPIALVLGVIALFRRQGGWGLIGMGAALVALLIDPTFWGLLGLAWLLDRYSWVLNYLS